MTGESIQEFERRVIEAVARNEFATIDVKKVRNVLSSEPFVLDDAFVQEYEGKDPEWGEMGWFTFKRTYARRVESVDPITGEITSNRTEEWTEVVRRVVEGNMNMIPGDPLVTQEYAQTMFKLIWNLVFTPPGRGLWMSGSEFSKRSGDAFNNCWFIETRPYHYGATNKIFTRITIDPEQLYVSYPFVFLFDMAMKGGGVGFSAEQDVIADIPAVANPVDLFLCMDPAHPDFNEVRKLADASGFTINALPCEEPHVDLMVADSREGWAEALAVVIDAHFTGEDTAVVIDFSDIREHGKPIRGFGGVSSGPRPLVELLYNYNNLFNSRVGQRLSSVDVVDCHNMTGRAVVAGNVRRTAEVALASPPPVDNDFTAMKNYKKVEHLGGWRDRGDGQWEQYSVTDEELLEQGYSQEQIDQDRYTAWAQNNHRWASNNSVVLDDPRAYDFGFIAPDVEANGEPGILNRYLSMNFGRIIDGYREKIDGKATGGNPCMEISLESGEPCNLTELMMPIMLKRGIDPAEVLPFMVQYTKRITFSRYEWELSQQVIERNRRLGVSFSGFMDWVLMKFGKSAIIGWKKYSKSAWHDMVWYYDDVPYTYHVEQPEYDPELYVIDPVYNPELVAEIDRMYKICKQADIEYSALLTEALGYTVHPSIKITTVKPSGTVSLLPGISPGVHAHYFRLGIRRIRLQSDDPLLKLAELAGYKTEPALQNPGSHVIEFPYKPMSAEIDGFRSIADLTIEEQFAMQALLCIYWADNMVSCTITFHEHEKPLIKHLLTQYRMRIKSTSLLPYSGHGYIQAPYEPYVEKDGKTPEEQYQEALKPIQWKPQELYQVLMSSDQFSDREMTLAEAIECAGGACPVR